MGPIRVLRPFAIRAVAVILLSTSRSLFHVDGEETVAAGGVDMTNLRPDSELSSNCFEFPASNFDRIR